MQDQQEYYAMTMAAENQERLERSSVDSRRHITALGSFSGRDGFQWRTSVKVVTGGVTKSFEDYYQ